MDFTKRISPARAATALTCGAAGLTVAIAGTPFQWAREPAFVFYLMAFLGAALAGTVAFPGFGRRHGLQAIAISGITAFLTTVLGTFTASTLLVLATTGTVAGGPLGWIYMAELASSPTIVLIWGVAMATVDATARFMRKRA